MRPSLRFSKLGVNLFSTDYDAPGETRIRDYILVASIARAHVLPLDAMDTVEAEVCNLGNGMGYSNLQVIAAVKRVTGRRRAFPDPRDLVDIAWHWRLQLLGGYSQ